MPISAGSGGSKAIDQCLRLSTRYALMSIKERQSSLLVLSNGKTVHQAARGESEPSASPSGDWLMKSCRRVGFKPRIVKEADGAASALAFVAAGFGVAVISEPLQKIPAKNVIFRDLAPEDRAWVPVAAAWKPDALTAPVASQFIDVLAQSCANENGGSRALRTVV